MILRDQVIEESIVANNQMQNTVITSVAVTRMIIIHTLTELIYLLYSNSINQGGHESLSYYNKTDSLIFLNTLRSILTKKYITILMNTHLEQLNSIMLSVQQHNCNITALKDEYRQQSELFISILRCNMKLAMIPEGIDSIINTTIVSNQQCLIMCYIDQFFQYHSLCMNRMELNNQSGDGIEEKSFYLYNIWTAVVELFTITFSNLQPQHNGFALVEGCCMLVRKHHYYISSFIKQTFQSIINVQQHKSFVGSSVRQVEPVSNNRMLSITQYISLTTYLIRLFTFIITHIHDMKDIHNLQQNNHKHKEIYMYCIQNISDFTVEIFHILPLILSNKGKELVDWVCYFNNYVCNVE